jgi:hypothetical protein
VDLMLIILLEAFLVVIVFFFLAVLAFGPYITGLMDKRNRKSGE